MSTIIENYQHEKGRLFVVGDIHGCYDELMQGLEQVNFDFQNDLLIAGSLIAPVIQTNK